MSKRDCLIVLFVLLLGISAAWFALGFAVSMSGVRVCAAHGNPPDCLDALHDVYVAWAAVVIPMCAAAFVGWLSEKVKP